MPRCSLADVMAPGGGDTLHLAGTDRSFSQLYPWLEEVALRHGVPDAALFGVHVALEEAVVNAAMHGVAPGEAVDIVVSFRVEPEALEVVVEDGGAAFDTAAAVPVAPSVRLQEDRPGGLGLTLLHRFCKDLRYERRQERNFLTLRFPR